jgi:photosystem I subunit 3
MKKYDADSAPTVALKATIERTEKRFDFYAKSGLLCGTDGLPHLIADPGFAIKNGHSADVLIPTFGFLYFAGLLGHSGRLYLEATGVKEKEIIIDVPLALSCLGRAVGWPLLVVGELNNGTLTEKDSNITVSPR